MKKSVTLRVSALAALLGVSGLSSCDSLDKSYNVYSDQVAPIRNDAVEVESGEGLILETEHEATLTELTMAPTSEPSTGAQQNAPKLPKPEAEAENKGASQNAPELPKPAAKPAADPKVKGARQNAPEPPKPAAKPTADPKVKGARQNAPEPPKPAAKPAADPKVKGARQNAPSTPKPVVAPLPPKPTVKGARQNAPTPKPAAKPTPKPEPKGARQNAPTPKPAAKPAVKPAAKPAPKAKGARQNAPAATKPAAKPAPKPAAKPATTARTPLVVTLKKGETLTMLARRHGVSLSALYKANGITAKTNVRPGSKITIPKRSFFRRLLRLPWVGTRSAATATAPAKSKSTPARTSSSSTSTRKTYTVKRGDTISGIASKFRVSTAALLKENKLSQAQARELRSGQVLRIPN